VATGLLGGTFDPVHLAHLIVAEAALEDLSLDRVIFMPCAEPPHKPGRQITDVRHRLEMARRATADNPRLEVSELEASRAAPSYTIDTVRELKQALGEGELTHFIMGSDSLEQFFAWKQPLELLAECEFAVVVRPGFDMSGADSRILERAHILRAPQVDISSSDIRRRVRDGRTIRYLVPSGVSDYIVEKKLYS
jgi:nicotinate-nucleotide adenylyltransferase